MRRAPASKFRIFIDASGNLYFWRSAFCALYQIQSPGKIKIKASPFPETLIVFEDSYSKPVLLLRFVSGKVSLFSTTYPPKVSGMFHSKAFTYFIFHAKSKAFAFHLLFQAAALTRPVLWRPPLYKIKWLQIKLLLRLRPSVWLLRGFKVFNLISTYDPASTLFIDVKFVYTYSHIYSRIVLIEYNIK